MKLIIAFIFSLCLLNLNLKAQKISNIQEKGVKLPADYKIDGSAQEWNDTFAAYNKSLAINYTIANDDKKIYLIIKITNPEVINKIINLGIKISFIDGSINNPKTISYPTYPTGLNYLYFPFSKKQTDGTKEAIAFNDSLKNVFNQKITEKSKSIKINGFESITDSLISIYNPDGIRVLAKFDSELAYTYEMAMPLKLIKDSKKINYILLLNGVPGKVILIGSKNDKIGYGGYDGINYYIGKATPENYNYVYPNSFDGVYQLYK